MRRVGVGMYWGVLGLTLDDTDMYTRTVKLRERVVKLWCDLVVAPKIAEAHKVVSRRLLVDCGVYSYTLQYWYSPVESSSLETLYA